MNTDDILKKVLQDRYNALIKEINKAEGIKSSKEKEIEKLKLEYAELSKECKENFDCEPNELSSKIKELGIEISNKIEEAEKLLKLLQEEN